jgi:hypothetical protein
MAGALTRMLGSGGITTGGAPGTIVTEDPYWYNVWLQLDATGKANGTGYTTESSRRGGTVTYNGNATITSAKFDFDGTGDYLSLADDAIWTPGSRATWDLRGVEFDKTTDDQYLFAHYNAQAAGRSWGLHYNAGALSFLASADGGTTTAISYTWTPTLATPYDISVTWDGSTIRIYIDGVFKASGAWSSAFFNSPNVLTVGARHVSGSPDDYFDGRVVAVRFTRGIDRANGSTTSYTRHLAPFATTSTTLTDSEWPNVVLLLEATSGGTIRDASSYDWPLSLSGGIVYSNSIQPFSGVNSVAFVAASSQYIAVSDNAAFEFGSGDYTLECMARHTVNNAVHHFVSHWETTGNVRSWAWRYRGDAATDIDDVARSSNGSSSAATVSGGAFTPVVDTWYHRAACRNGANTRIFADGVQKGSTDTTNVNFFDGTAPLMIGAIGGGGATQFMGGYLAEVRITKGVARYTAGFTPPSAAFPRG